MQRILLEINSICFVYMFIVIRVVGASIPDGSIFRSYDNVYFHRDLFKPVKYTISGMALTVQTNFISILYQRNNLSYETY